MDENKSFVRKSPLKDKIHDRHEGIRINEEALEILQDQIELISEILMDLSVENVINNKRKTIMKTDVENSFEEFMSNKIMIDKVISVLQNSLEEMAKVKVKSISNYLEV